MANLKISNDISINGYGVISFQPGDIVSTLSTTAPNGWIMCDGQTISQSDYPELYAFLSAYYAGTAGKVPDLNGITTTYKPYMTSAISTDSNTAFNPSFTGHSHSSNITTSAQSYSVAAHTHNYSVGTNNGDSGHGHGVSGGGGSGASGGYSSGPSTTANASSSGSSGGQSDNSHSHQYSTAASQNDTGFTHSHNVGGSFSATATHAHTATEAITTDTQFDYLNSYGLKWMIKV